MKVLSPPSAILLASLGLALPPLIALLRDDSGPWLPLTTQFFVFGSNFGLAGLFVVPAGFLLTLGAIWFLPKGQVLVPVLAIASAAAQALYLALAWRSGVRYWGASYTVLTSAFGLLLAAVAVLAAVRGLRSGRPLDLHFALWLVFLGFSWLAFPYLGELP